MSAARMVGPLHYSTGMLADPALGSINMFSGQNNMSSALTLSKAKKAARAMVAHWVLTFFPA
jgi:hypothetical protein